MNVLPLSMYFELHDLLFVNSIENGNYKFESNKLPQRKRITSQNQQLELKTNLLRKRMKISEIGRQNWEIKSENWRTLK